MPSRSPLTSQTKSHAASRVDSAPTPMSQISSRVAVPPESRSMSSPLSVSTTSVGPSSRGGLSVTRADAANADSRSARRSSTASMPTDRRTSDGGTASGESATDAWVIGAGSSISDSTAPSDSARVKRRVHATKRRARILATADARS